MRTLLMVSVLSLASLVHADTIISTSLLEVNPEGSEFAFRARCTVANITSKQVTVNSIRFINENGVEHTQVQFPSNCTFPNPIFPGQACINGLAKTELAGTDWIRCEVNTKGSSKSLRVFLEIEDRNSATPDAFTPNFRSDIGR
jgi:hypothetical protein